MRVVLCILALLWPMAASAQTVFFDDFDGNALLPHWILQPPPSHWEHTVSNSMLNVTALFFPGIPHAGSNFADLLSEFSPLADFRIDVWMGWDQGTPPHALNLSVLGPGGNPIVASIGYRNDPGAGQVPVIFGGASGQGVNIPAPPPGIYQFTITRVASDFEFYLDGNLFGTFPDTFGRRAAGLHFEFIGPVSGAFGTLRIDRVQVVPVPGLLSFAFPLGLTYAFGRMRQTLGTNQGARK